MSYASDQLLKETAAKVAELERAVSDLTQIFNSFKLTYSAPSVRPLPLQEMKRGPGRPRKEA